MEEITKIAIFKGKEIRKTIYKNEWWFSVINVVEALTDSVNPRDYWFKMKIRVKSEDGIELSTICRQLKLEASDGKMRETDCANTEGIFRIIESIPSPKAEPFKRWLARVGYERVQEIEDPELATKRTRALYKAKGYPDSWIEKRMRGIEVRETLTDEWKKRNVGADKEYAILTAEISRAAFGMTPSEYKKYKGLKRENLRDHMKEMMDSLKLDASISTPRQERQIRIIARQVASEFTLIYSQFIPAETFEKTNGVDEARNMPLGIYSPKGRIMVFDDPGNLWNKFTKDAQKRLIQEYGNEKKAQQRAIAGCLVDNITHEKEKLFPQGKGLYR